MLQKGVDAELFLGSELSLAEANLNFFSGNSRERIWIVEEPEELREGAEPTLRQVAELPIA